MPDSNPMRLRSMAAALVAIAAGAAALTLGAPAHAAGAHALSCQKATIGGKHTCLRVGQTCKKRYERQYQSKGLTCVRKNGTYRLKRQSMTF
jgi:uncharacterized membrane protein